MAPPPAKTLPFAILLPLLLALAIAALVTSIIATRFPHNKIRNSYYIYDDPDDAGYDPNDTYSDPTYGSMQIFPDNLNLGSLWAIFGISIGMVLLVLAFVVSLWSKAPGVQSVPKITRVPLFISVIFVVAAAVEFIFSFAQHYASTWFDVDEFLADQFSVDKFVEEYGPYSYSLLPETVGESGSWSLEAWTCQTQEVWKMMRFGGYGRTCKIAAAARWLTIPTLAMSLMLFAVVMVEFRRRRRAVSAEEGREKGNELSPVQSEHAAKA